MAKAASSLIAVCSFPRFPAAAAARCKEVFHAAARMAKLAIAARPAESSVEKLHWASLAFRAARAGVFTRLVNKRHARRPLAADTRVFTLGVQALRACGLSPSMFANTYAAAFRALPLERYAIALTRPMPRPRKLRND